MSEPAGAPSDVARAYARLAPALPQATARDLLTLLNATIADPGQHTDRESRLGLLVRILERQTELPDTDTYDQARRKREDGWPSASQLSRYYGGWLGALDAAAPAPDAALPDAPSWRSRWQPTASTNTRAAPAAPKAAALRLFAVILYWARCGCCRFCCCCTR